jgi:hypothetical protein
MYNNDINMIFFCSSLDKVSSKNGQSFSFSSLVRSPFFSSSSSLHSPFALFQNIERSYIKKKETQRKRKTNAYC